MSETHVTSHSADVKMWLDCGEFGMLELSRVAPSAVVAKQPKDIPPCDAKLFISVDGQVMRTDVRLAKGFSAARPSAAVLTKDGSAPF